MDDDGAGGGGGEAGPVGDDVLNGVGGCGARVDLHRAHRHAVDVCRDPKVEIGLRAGDSGVEVVVGGTDVDDRGVAAVDLDDGRLR